MLTRIFCGFLLFLGSSLPVSSNAKEKPEPTATPTLSEKDYFVAKSFPLHLNGDDMEGRLELWQDKAFKGRKQTALPEEKDYFDGVLQDEFKGAYLVVRGPDGKIWSVKSDLETWVSVEKSTDLESSGRSIYIVTWYRDVGNPYTKGTGTNLYVLKDRKLKPLRATDSKTKKWEDVWMLHCRRGQWKIVPGDKGKGKEIWAVLCETYTASPRTHYQRYAFDGKQWLLHDHEVHELWDSYEDAFPEAFFLKGRRP